jgi:hypothetical protein
VFAAAVYFGVDVQVVTVSIDVVGFLTVVARADDVGVQEVTDVLIR